MTLRLFLSALLPFFALLLPTAAFPSSAYTPSKLHAQNPTDVGIDSSLSHTQPQQVNKGLEKHARSPSYGQRPDIILHGKNELEREMSLCEAGIVSACRASIEATKSESDLAQNDELLETPHKLPVIGGHGAHDIEHVRLFPPIGLLLISFAIFCFITVIRGCIPGIFAS
jgi:hypothetical protein